MAFDKFEYGFSQINKLEFFGFCYSYLFCAESKKKALQKYIFLFAQTVCFDIYFFKKDLIVALHHGVMFFYFIFTSVSN